MTKDQSSDPADRIYSVCYEPNADFVCGVTAVGEQCLMGLGGDDCLLGVFFSPQG
jgi:hypothetical protein